jgi:hypothetical protein
MALLNFMLNMRMILESRWIHNHVRHIEFHVCPDHEEWEEVHKRLHGALEAHLRGLEEQVSAEADSQMSIEEWDNQ